MDAQQANQQKLMDLQQQQVTMAKDSNEQQQFWQRAQLAAMNNNNRSTALPGINLNQIANQAGSAPYFLRKE